MHNESSEGLGKTFHLVGRPKGRFPTVPSNAIGCRDMLNSNAYYTLSTFMARR